MKLRVARPEDNPVKCGVRLSPHSQAYCEVPVQVHWSTCPAQDFHAGRTRAGYWKIRPVRSGDSV
jgi:hypothetical protein